MSRSSLSQFPQGFPSKASTQGYSAKARPAWWQNVFLTRIESSVRVKKMVFDIDIEGKFRRKTRIRPGSAVQQRRFRRLFAAVQSSASSKLSNPLINQRFLVLPRSPGANGRRPHHLAETTAEIMTKACAS